MPRPSKLEPFLLQAALNALERQQEQVDQQIAEVRTMLGRRRAGAAPSGVRPGKRMLSLAARKRIAEAQRKRWAEYKKLRESQAEATAAKPRAKRARGAKAARKEEASQEAGAEA